MMDTSEVLDLTKENVQPLVHGRSSSKLSTVLQVDRNYQLQQTLRRQREEFELQIRMYDGDDPLQLRYDYVKWLEQSYPCLGPDTNIVTFLEETLAEFKNNDEYKQDPRYVSLVIKYIRTQPNPLEIYSLVYSENIGTKLALFYKAWAEELDVHGDVKQANHVFQLGIDAQAEPIQELEEAQMQFHMTVGRRVILNGSSTRNQETENSEPERQVLGKLKKATVGVTRLKTVGPGRMVMTNSDMKKPLQNTKPSTLHVFVDENSEDNMYVKEPSLKNSHFKIKSDTIHKENLEKPGVWTKKKTPKYAAPIPRHPTTPSFQIHVDENSPCEPSPMQNSIQMTSALKTKKFDTSHGIGSAHQAALFENGANSKERYMFCKNKIYIGKSELQLEELRAARYRKDKYGTCIQNIQPSIPVIDDIPVCVPEPEDPTKKPMYRKQQIYISNTKEIQLEELRALDYKNRKSKPIKQISPSKEKPADDIPVCIPYFNDKTKFMYPHSEIYIGNNKELQLDEIRAAIYRKRQQHSLIKSKQDSVIKSSSKKKSFAIFTDDNLNNSSNQSNERGTCSANSSSSRSKEIPRLTKILSFSTSDDDSVEKKILEEDINEKKISNDSVKKLGLFDNFEKNVAGGIQMNNLRLTDESFKEGLSIIDNMWKSPACNKNSNVNSSNLKLFSPLNNSNQRCSSTLIEDQTKSRAPIGGMLETSQSKLDVSGVTMNYTVNTKEVMKMVDDMWSSSSHLQVTPVKGSTTINNNEDITFKKPVSIKKPSSNTIISQTNPSVETTTPFKIFTDDDMEDKLTPEIINPKTPKFNIYTDDERGTDFQTHVEPKVIQSKTPRFNIYTDDELGTDFQTHVEPKVTQSKTPKFNVYTDDRGDDDINSEKLSEKVCSKSSTNLIIPIEAPKTPFNIFCDEEDLEEENKIKKKAQALKFDNDGSGGGNGKSSKQFRTKNNFISNDGNIEYKNMSSPELSKSFKQSVQNCASHSDRENVLPVEMYEVYNTQNVYNTPKVPIHIHCDEDDNEEDMAKPLGQDDIKMTNEPPRPLELPYVPPPTNIDDEPLGHEFKENFPPGDFIKNKQNFGGVQENPRVLNGYLVPSNLQVNQQDVEDDDDNAGQHDEEEEMSDITCNTRAFNFILPSSTPFLNMRSKTAAYTPGCNNNGSFYQEPSYKTPSDTQNLSIILEASKEKSSSSSGSSGSSVAPSSYFSCEKKTLLTPIYEHNGVSDLEVSVSDLALNTIDPFDEKLIDDLLTQIKFPLTRHRVGYECFFSELHPLKVKSKNMFGTTEYTITQELGKGAYARVLMGKTIDNIKVALKQQKPACVWEWYICKEIETRLKNHNLDKIIQHYVIPKHIYIYKNSSILVSDWAKYGNLLDLVNLYKVKMGKPLNEQVAFKLSLEMVRAIYALHKIQIIHGDIKPDNFVVCNLMKSGEPCLKLIDYGRSIDMTLFPPRTAFTTVVTTDGFQCNEMKEGKEWNYHTDLYGLAGSIFCCLMGKYMKTIKRGSKWVLSDTIFRYLNRGVWESIFEKLLNVPYQYELSLLEDIIETLEQAQINRFNPDDELQIVDNLLIQIK